VTWSTAGAKTVSVNYTNPAGCPAVNATVKTVTVYALPTPTIAGSPTACQTTTATYTTQTSQSAYVWNVSAGGAITGGQGTSSVNILWNTPGAQTVSVNYANSNGCTAAAPATFAVTVNAAPVPTITGNNNLCANSGYYDYLTQTGQTGYVWTVSSGGTITAGQGTADLQVVWNTPGAQSVTVNYTNASGCTAPTATVFNVTVNGIPGTPGAISGSSTVCAGSMGIAYSVPPITNAASYVWTLPTGATIASGSGTNSITVNFAANAVSGNITVYGNSICGNGPASSPFAVTVNQLPDAAGTITGPASVCQGENNVVYTVPTINGATGYTWGVPTGATITGGANTNSITVDFSSTASSGSVAVYGTNTCGSGTNSSLSVSVNPVPPTPTITENDYVLTSSAATGNQWYHDGTAITGATGQTYTVPATAPGYYWTVVTLLGCSSGESNHIYIRGVGVGEHNESAVNIYPVPNDGQFKLQMNSPAAESFDISICNNIGATVYTKENVMVNGLTEINIDLRPIASGVYTMIIRNGNSKVVRKIIINR